MLRRSLLVLCVVAACGGPFKDAMKRGDQYASAGMWDQAAAEYQKAQQIEPGNTEVQIKLRQVAQKRSGERLARGKALIARGEIEAGLAVIQEAAKLDPASTDAQRTLDDANQQALRRAEELLFGSNQSVKMAAVAGLGVAFMSRWSVQAAVNGGILRILPLRDLRMIRHFSWATASRELHGGAGRFLAWARKNPPPRP